MGPGCLGRSMSPELRHQLELRVARLLIDLDSTAHRIAVEAGHNQISRDDTTHYAEVAVQIRLLNEILAQPDSSCSQTPTN